MNTAHIFGLKGPKFGAVESKTSKRWTDIDIELRQYNKMFGLVSGNRNLIRLKVSTVVYHMM